jgi:hypothetical protein
MFIIHDWRLSLFELPKLLLNLRTACCLILAILVNHIVGFWTRVPKFLAELHADALLISLSHLQWHTTDFGWLPSAEQSEQVAVIHTCTQRSNVTHAPLPVPGAFLFKRKGIWSNTFWSGHMLHYFYVNILFKEIVIVVDISFQNLYNSLGSDEI